MSRIGRHDPVPMRTVDSRTRIVGDDSHYQYLTTEQVVEPMREKVRA